MTYYHEIAMTGLLSGYAALWKLIFRSLTVRYSQNRLSCPQPSVPPHSMLCYTGPFRSVFRSGSPLGTTHPWSKGQPGGCLCPGRLLHMAEDGDLT